ncbi:putative ABC transporter ATP-binding protein [Gordonia namibiensis NBRC 108229]|uniref:Putative ABC transporter ATP-binding protein n=1 Tax=Gordonia namibiensis NBRC 108229 TaxID=1208314 RepID=K6XIB0_9ACTN|nr:ABC transporter ATP-binding protein [Gordonia namibiensis]GAB98579.1 putative ABC transporter ATP-binding protein [Gordonia namibiensis NBRC 108229]
MSTGVSDVTGRPPADLAVDVHGLHKSFGRFDALRGLDLTVRRGEVHGFLGPNGAGKSTTIRVLLGLLRADAGEVRLLGGDPWRDVVELHRRLAYVPGDVSLWPSMTGGEMIDLLGAMRGGLDEERRADLVRRFELDTTKRGRQYSKGNRQKVAIVAALASDVELLILDEPTSGLDPLMESVFQDVVGKAKSRGTTVLLSSHILAEAETLADRLSIIRDGAIVATGTLADLRGHTRTSVRADLDTIPSDEQLAELHDVAVDGHRLGATVDSDRIGDAMTMLTSCGLRSLTVEPPSLESLFLRLYEAEGAMPGER